eukprot:CAMPEP_0182866750 /NCGR_PEP_ID=MMETSP0034_2-20130328/8362_1 /TAXON_ID=156128 /ORGANISM="Nephroselmis pyriformis, Strain CCMP717" /LENGTH=76 /DNA_ID=CAMNT_0024999081 /DNA_START=901 /DNA_END=1132 /DNA_ORIENTATION=-
MGSMPPQNSPLAPPKPAGGAEVAVDGLVIVRVEGNFAEAGVALLLSRAFDWMYGSRAPEAVRVPDLAAVHGDVLMI